MIWSQTAQFHPTHPIHSIVTGLTVQTELHSSEEPSVALHAARRVTTVLEVLAVPGRSYLRAIRLSVCPVFVLALGFRRSAAALAAFQHPADAIEGPIDLFAGNAQRRSDSDYAIVSFFTEYALILERFAVRPRRGVQLDSDP